jgi:mono/diheme cytochrome c family protein
MLKGVGLAAIGLLTIFAAGGARQGCQDLRRSATWLSYYPIRDMRHSVAIMPQKVVLLVPDSASVPVAGIDRDLGREVLAKTLVNPTPPAGLEASIRRGEVKFRKTCVGCHGNDLSGHGPVAPRMMTAADLLALPTRQRADGFLYACVRHGGIIMPSHGAQVTPQEAWDLVNYVRRMQKVSPR